MPYWGPPGAPYQGLILPAAAGKRGGQWRFQEEEALWKSHGVTRTCPPALAPLPPARPCLPVSNGTGQLVGTALAWSFVSHDEALCALEPNGSRTLYTGHICASDGSIMWDNFSTPGRSVKRGAKTLQCAWSCGSEPEYCGVGCGMSQRDAVQNPALPAKVCAKHGSTSVQAQASPTL